MSIDAGERSRKLLLKLWIWPSVSSRKDSLFAITEAFLVLLAVACFSAFMFLVGLSREDDSGFPVFHLLEIGLLAGSAFGVRLKSRVAAISGFATYAVFHLTTVVTRPSLVSGISILMGLAILHGVRGTFAFRRLGAIPPGTPSVENSFAAFGSHHATQRTDNKAE